MYQYPPLNKIVQDAAMYDMLANYYKYLDPQKHIYYYQLHLMCMQQLCQTVEFGGTPYRSSGNPNNNNNNNNQRAKVRVLHASPDAPRVDIYVNGEKTFENMMYYQISPYMDLQAGSYEIEVYPAGQTNDAVLSENVRVGAGKHYTIAAADRLEDLRLVVVEDEPDVPQGKTKVRVWHLSPNAPQVDIAVADGDVLFEDVSFRDASDYLELDPGTVTLEVREAGTDNIVLTLRDTNLRANEVYTVAAIGIFEGRPRFEALILNP
ncbi:hypothetical protein BKP35_07430 [Anaerobacillus arseniciselenatis]|uniref:DUF4397 domain-containing protein n=1 Tax=Anaerobacillus arseniciselenatis TaxID=85682 RepID=A0A1S2LNC1_9BACI|nr:DUF4397 domain-containing protein [Anaerobacillus arseniciselenatis]OIJ14028.1 hypothetical protein BKP35_07430 [Anaerobacillus arseniciselenatis]